MKHTSLLALLFATIGTLCPAQTATLRIEGQEVTAVVNGMIPTGVGSDFTKASREITPAEAKGVIKVGPAKAGAFVVYFTNAELGQSLIKLVIVSQAPKGQWTLLELGGNNLIAPATPKPEAEKQASLLERFWQGVTAEVMREAAKRTGGDAVKMAALKAPVYVLTCAPAAVTPATFAICTAKEGAEFAVKLAQTMLEHTVDVLVEKKTLSKKEGLAIKSSLKSIAIVRILMSPEEFAAKVVGTTFGTAGIAMDWADAKQTVRTGVDVLEATTNKWLAVFELVKKAGK